MTGRRTKRHCDRGFTLTEVLCTLAIVIVLFSLAMIPIGQMQRELRQTALDSRAELLFAAAQNRLTQLKAAGRQEVYQTGATEMEAPPADSEEGAEELRLVYVTSGERENADSAAVLLSSDGAELELWNAHWVVEYDADSGSVYAVFYSEEEMNYSPQGFDSLRYRSQRLRAGAVVGYYGGDSVGAYETGKLEPRIEVVNAEQLYLRMVCDTQGGAELTFTVTLTDESGNSAVLLLDRFSPEVERSRFTYTATVMLDDLSAGAAMRFAQQSRFRDLTPGEDLRITVKVTANESRIDQAIVTAETNSLFAAVRDGADGRTAVISYARHLQNLDEASGINGGAPVTSAVQEQDIRFGAGEDDGWAELYPGLSFQPIRNAQLKRYESSYSFAGGTAHPAIYDLPIETTGDAGLFASFSDGVLSHIRLSGAKITGTGKVGGLAGSVSGSVMVEGCQVYLSNVSGQTSGKTEKDLWLEGNATGGLVGCVNNGTLTICDSFASTVLRGSETAGGLVGHAAASVKAERAYADCYLYSDGAAGGLLGTRAAGFLSLKNCYAAGFLNADETAGLAAIELFGGDTLESVYTACAPLEKDTLTCSTAKLSPSGGMPTLERVYYLSEAEYALLGSELVSYTDWSGENRAAAATKLGAAFSADTGNTFAYNLMEGMGLIQYSYPKLAGLPHYGDWQAEFESGSLVYYEKYADGSCGFYGANISRLSDTLSVLGDGYGMIYADHAPETVTVTLEGGATATLSGTDAIRITVPVKEGMKDYYLLPLPAVFVQDAPESAAFYRKLTADGKTYFYHPHFANTAVAGSEAPSAPGRIILRTARHFFALSERYEAYASLLPKNSTEFLQTRGINYASYDWAAYGTGGIAVSEQRPIAEAEGKPFAYTYDGGGYPISGVSFVSGASSQYAGMFGRNDGELRSIVLVNEETLGSADAARIRMDGTVQFRTVYMGMLAGRNSGRIYNCAAAGYEMDCHAYSGATFYIGGLVGYNTGSIRSSSVSAPCISGSGTFATICAGGFAGRNSGQIRQCYAMAAVEIMTIRDGDVTIAGFAGSNTGTVRSSYCATALSSAGAETFGFSPEGGGVSDCFYLNGGAYTFAGAVHLYQYAAGSTGAAAVNDEELAAQYIGGFTAVERANTFAYPNTPASESGYPFPSSVSAGGESVHYGDWVMPADLGTLGVVYWEQEEKGPNSGLHFSFLGFDHGLEKSGSNLCTAHDDGGVIRAYGYGYYWKESFPEPSLMVSATDGHFPLGNRADTVKAALEAQVQGYTFLAYQTGEDGLRLESASAANGTWKLTQTEGAETVSYTYTLSPFFANAYTCTSHSSEPGSSALPYEIRSVEQLQYINWSMEGGAGSALRDVTSANYQNFPYLQYATVTGQGAQTRADAERKRPAQCWQQTHDINGGSLNAEGKSFHPIAGAVEHKWEGNNPSYNMVLYNWFGGKYDGQSYYIKNLGINSHCYNVGVFGTTAGAEIRNIVLYSDNGTVIQRRTNPSDWAYQDRGLPASADEYICSYALGGLVGIAYDYGLSSTGAKSTISNCSIAGYVVADNSKNALQLGEAAIGGLIGVSSVDLRNCSAVVDLQINCTHRWKNDGSLNSAKWGNHVRVGGLVGGLRYAATNCYTGGSISVSAETLKERIVSGDNSNQSFADGSNAVQIKWAKDRAGYGQNGTYNKNLNPATYVYIGGIGGSGFSANFYNFTNKSNSDDGTPTFNNCYTYIDLPDMEGTITGICLIGSTADRYRYARAEINNCYYLESSRESVGFDRLSKCISPTNYSLAGLLSSDAAQNAMLHGDLSYLRNYLWESSAQTNTTNGLTELSYDQMASRNGGAAILKKLSNDQAVYDSFTGALGSGFDWVTVTEGGATVHGKYSFPGRDAALQGQDYPFPTVLTQMDTFGSTVNLHYGAWPKSGLFWSEGITSMDLIADYQAAQGRSGIGLRLTLENVPGTAATEQPTFRYTDETVVRATATAAADGNFDVWLEGLRPGATEVLAELGGYTARMTITVTAELTVRAEPHIVEQYVGEAMPVTLSATDKNGALHHVDWEIINEDGTLAEVSAPVEAMDGSTTVQVKGLAEGETALHISAVCSLGSAGSYTGTTALSILTHAQGILGAANTTDEAVHLYREGTLNKPLTDWEDGKGYADTAYESGAPDCGSGLFLYGKGAQAELSNFAVSAVTVERGTQSINVLADQRQYSIRFGEIETNGTYTFLPLSVRGERAGEINLTVTLKDRRNGTEYALAIPYTLTESDTKVTAVYTDLLGAEISLKELAYGAAAGVPTQEAQDKLRAEAILPEGYEFAGLGSATGWAPDITAPLYADTTFAPLTRRSGHTVTFAGIGVEQTQITLEKGASISGTQWPTAPARDGYEFIGWTTNGTDLYTGGGTYTPTGDTTFRVKWRKAVTITVKIWDTPVYAWNNVTAYDAGYSGSFSSTDRYNTQTIKMEIDGTQVVGSCGRSFGYSGYTYLVTIARDQFPADEW